MHTIVIVLSIAAACIIAVLALEFVQALAATSFKPASPAGASVGDDEGNAVHGGADNL